MQVQRRFIEIIDVSNVGTVNEHSPAAERPGKRQIFSRNHSRFQRTSNREKLTLKFSTICSSLFLIRKSGFSIACAEELLICFPFCISYFVRGGELEINGSTCVRFDTCQPQGSCGSSRNCSGPNWGLWDGLLTSSGGVVLSLA